MAKRLCFRKHRPNGFHSSPVKFELTLGGECIGTVNQHNKEGWYWVVYGDKVGIPTHNSLWGGVGAARYPDAEQAKSVCMSYARAEMEKNKGGPK